MDEKKLKTKTKKYYYHSNSVDSAKRTEKIFLRFFEIFCYFLRFFQDFFESFSNLDRKYPFVFAKENAQKKCDHKKIPHKKMQQKKIQQKKIPPPKKKIQQNKKLP